MIATTPEELAHLVEIYSRFDEVVYDLETMYVPTPEEQERFDLIHEEPKRLWTPDDKAWVDVFKLKATDPTQNTTIWFGMATAGRSDAVATGHPHGELLHRGGRETVIACEYYGEDDDRYWTPGGKPSTRKVEVTVPDQFGPPPPQLTIEQACEILQPLFFDPDRRVINQNLKFDIKSLVRHFGDFIPGPYGDTMIAQHLVDENAFAALNLGKMVEAHLGHEYSKLGSKGVHNFSFNEAARYAEQDAKYTWLLWQKYKRILQAEGLWDLFEFEMDVMALLMRKEYAGAYIDRKSMDVTRAAFEKRKEATVADLLANHPVPPTFNFDSPKQKGDLLYGQLKAPVLKKTDGGQPSTDADTLEKLVVQGGPAGEVAKLFLDYAEVSKVIGTYFVGMGAKLDTTGFLHPDFTQHVADTNRMSCVVGETLVKTRRGDVPIIDVVVGDEVLTHKGRWRKVVAHLDQGVQETVRVHCSDGGSLECTDDHRLFTPSGWAYVRDLTVGAEVYGVEVEKLGNESGERRGGADGVPGGRPSDGTGAGIPARNPLPQCPTRSQGGPVPRAVLVREESPKVQVQDGGEQPHGREVRTAAPQLRGGGGDGGWVPADQGERSLRVGASAGDGRHAGSGETSQDDGSAPHRWGQDEQRPGQPGSGHAWWAPAASRRVVTVVSLTPMGSAPTFDLTVEDDESYVTSTLLSHNCREPNVHNIPRDSDMRDMFVAPKGYVVIGADYDQIELRGICVEAQDSAMQEVFLSGEDVHATTAALVLNKTLDEVSSEERTIYGKMPNFLIGYGGTAYTLALKTGIGEDAAQKVLDAYFARFTRIMPWKREVVELALSRTKYVDGKLVVPPYVETMMGYRRRLPGLLVNPRAAGSDRRKWRELNRIRNRAERQAVNSITQGSAAETLKIAMLDIDNYCQRTKFPMRLVLNIHDEVLCYCEESHAEEGLEIVESLMSDVVNPFTGEPPLRDYIPLIASGYIADRWQKG